MSSQELVRDQCFAEAELRSRLHPLHRHRARRLEANVPARPAPARAWPDPAWATKPTPTRTARAYRRRARLHCDSRTRRRRRHRGRSATRMPRPALGGRGTRGRRLRGIPEARDGRRRSGAFRRRISADGYPTQPKRRFDVALSPSDGRVRITRSDTGRVALALSVEEASQVRTGLKGALQRNGKNPKKHAKRKRP
jgi:hypothetical protein